MQLAGKVAVVTGAAVGIGRAIALKLARRGCNVAVNYSRSQAEAQATAGEVRGAGVQTLLVQADVSNDRQVRAMIDRVVQEFGRLDLLVNNAGFTTVVAHSDLDGVKEEHWDKILRVNLKGPFYTTRAAAPALRAARGSIVNISSIAGIYGVGSSIPYCASKAALNNLTLTLARALAPEIRVNAVAPGFVDTRWWKEREGYENIKQYALDRTPLQRLCQPDDVATVAVDLLTSDVVTGQIVVVDGGMGLMR
jgi:3-oxoacyl-[acyl-carrier protein] reductase